MARLTDEQLKKVQKEAWDDLETGLYDALGELIERRAADAPSGENQVGMYKLQSDPNHHRVVVGDFTITRMDDSAVWIESESRGDGGSFSDANFEAAIKQFYEGYF